MNEEINETELNMENPITSTPSVSEAATGTAAETKAEDQEWDRPEHSRWLRLFAFLQLFAFAFSYMIIWYYPHKNQVGNFVWNPEQLTPYFLGMGGIIFLAALLILVLPSMNKSFSMPALLTSSLVCILAVTIFFRFLVTFIAVTLHATGDFSFPPIDPFPFLKWAKFLIIILM